ncbi:MAG TPA: metal ABC transporter permease [Solirubrobacterales bacterium]|jgi:ABC-type Mn2+/Zn2+ transport system permease subunit|nr:metal ABC transporter permease [Solirubrobacterales bacterium]HNC15901.1 metal ABC transporter permease [Solirubrobacterales bacterium]
MIDWLIDPLTYGFTVRAVIEIAVLGAVSGAVGCWVVLYGISYSAESLAHGMFPGLVGAALLGIPLLLGGAAGIILAGLLIALVGRLTRGRPGNDDAADTAIAVVVTSLFGLGVLMALSPDSPPGIQALLFGDPLGITDGQLISTAALGAAVLALLWLGHDRLLAVGFDNSSGQVAGLSPGLVQAMLLVLVAVTVLIGVQGLGNLLVAAILVGPAAAARLLTSRMGSMIGISVAVAVASGIAGLYLSFHGRIAAGAAIVICLVAAWLLAALFAAVRSRFRRPDSIRKELDHERIGQLV